MKNLIYILVICGTLSSCSIFNPQSEQITNTYFSDRDQIESITPALLKKKGFTNYEELINFIEARKSEHPNTMTLTYLGESQRGKQIPMVTLTNPNGQDKIKVWAQGGLHGNEPGSTESMLYLIDKLLNDDKYSYLLDRIEIAIVPMANIDGYLKSDRYAANGLDLNRDQTKLMAPESIVLKKAFSDFNPAVGMDFHEYKPYRKSFTQLSTFGVTAYYDAMFLYSGNLNVPENLRTITKNLFVDKAQSILEKNNLSSRVYTSTTNVDGDIHFNQGSNSARSSATSYSLNNSISTLFEIRGVGIGRTSFKRRIQTAFLCATTYLETTYNNVDLIRKELAISAASQQDLVPITSKKIYPGQVKVIDLDTEQLLDMQVTIRDAMQLSPVLSRKRPKAYLIDSKETQLIEKLKTLGAEVEVLQNETTQVVDTYHITYYKRSTKKYEKMNQQTVKTELLPASMTFPKGTFKISMNQQRSQLIAEVLEPEAPNSFVSFGVLKTDKNAVLPIYRINK